MPVSPAQLTTLLTSPPLSDLPSHLPALGSLISANLHTFALYLARIASPTTNPSFIHRAVASLPSQAASQRALLAARRDELGHARLQAAASLTQLLALLSSALSALVRSLESKHGPIARSLEFKAYEAALLAQKQEAEADSKLRTATRDMYTPQALRALRAYVDHLRDGRLRAGEQVRFLRAELAGYGVDAAGGGGGRPGSRGKGTSKEKTMREMARVYRDMSRQADEVRADLERLTRT